ncbi:hypothetical protein ACFL35_08030 [Candidatus Riflebacteria bacterium]
MSQAYVPSLEVVGSTLITKERTLPLKGDVNVKVGDIVNQGDIVASTYLPGKPVPINAATKLGIPPYELPECMLKNEGDEVLTDETIAIAKSFFGLFSTPLISPITGTIDSISRVSGQIILREAPIPVEVNAYISGKIIEVQENDGVTIETQACFIQGIFGIGQEKFGPLTRAVPDRKTILTPDHIRQEHQGRILLAGGLMTHEAIKKAEEYGVLGIIGGGLNDKDLKAILGYDLGVAITGNETGPTLIITEGFGDIPMSEGTFNLLNSHQGDLASINGATQIRAGVIRPEVIIPLVGDKIHKAPKMESKELAPGTNVRIIRNPHFGEIGEIIDLPHAQTLIPTEAKVRVATIRLKNGQDLTLPRANIEIV